MRTEGKLPRVVTVTVEGSVGEKGSESVKSKNRVHVSQLNAIRKCYEAIGPAATCYRIQITGKHAEQL